MMRTNSLIPVNEFCASHNLDISFISSLEETGLIDVISISEDLYIDAGELKQLEKIVRFHYEFNINLEGIETIIHLLKQIKYLQDENLMLRNKLRIYESED
jgi:chaperone modulatory protein CbpM